MSLCPSGATCLCYALRNTGLPARVLLVSGGTTRVLLVSGGQRECYSSFDSRRSSPVWRVWFALLNISVSCSVRASAAQELLSVLAV